MLGKALFLIFPLLCIAYTEFCKPGAPGAFKVRLSIKKALGNKAYTWNTDEEFLFKAVMAFVMRAHVNNTIEISNILLCNVTQRVSFWFVVTSPSNRSEPILSTEVETAIRLKRNRINSAFLLSDSTLEFVDIPPTIAPKTESSRPSWLIVFGVVLGVLGVASIFFVVSGLRRRRKKKTPGTEVHDEDGMASVQTNEISEAGAESTLF